MAYLIHRTREGERWDLIAWQYYRDVRQVPALMAANPHAPVAPTLPSGLKIVVPIISAASVTGSLPPWRRGDD